MSLQKKYYYTFRSLLDNVVHTVEIWQDTTATITAVEIRGDFSPFVVSSPILSDKLQPVQGTGCQINIVSQTNMQFLGLYTANMQEYQILLYRGASLRWCGWLDSEIYSEQFSELTGYSVSISGTDGFALLDRINYLQADGSKYTGIVSQWDVLKIILAKLNLPLFYLKVFLSTTHGTIPAQQTIFHTTYVNNDNFYDEDGEPATMRSVLESLLRPYGAFIVQDEGSVTITDLNAVVRTAFTSGHVYSWNTWAYSSSTDLFRDLGDLSTIGFRSSSQLLDIIPGVNKQVIKYSPYQLTDIIDYEAGEDFEDALPTTTRGATNFQWVETPYRLSSIWDAFNNGKFCKLEGIDGANTDVVDYYLDIPYYGNYEYGTTATKSFTYAAKMPFLIGSENYKLKIELKAFPRISNDLNGTLTNNLVSTVRLVTRLKIGTKKYIYSIGTLAPLWVDAASNTIYDLILPITNRVLNTGTYPVIYAAIEDRWTDLKINVIHNYDNLISRNDFIIPLPSYQIDGDVLEFEIYAYQVRDMNNAVRTITDLRLKDIKLTIVDAKGNDVEQLDTEFVGYMNPQYKEEGETITLIQGTNLSTFPVERGGLMKYDGTDYTWITEWTREGVTDNIENLLLRSYVGNYSGKTLQLTVTTKRLLSVIGYLTYTNWLPGHKFMIVGFTHDHAEGTSELTLQEIFPDSLTIDKSW